MGELYRPENNPDISGKIEKDIIGGGFDFERIENLPDSAEPGVFYRGVPAEDALSGILGKLIVEANPKGESHILGPRDNVSLRLNEAIGFNPLPGSNIEHSGLNRDTFLRYTGPIKVTEVALRFAGKESGRPSRVKIFSPREFVKWYKENMLD